MVTFINGGNTLAGELAINSLAILQSAFITEGWAISNIASNSFTINKNNMYYDFSLIESPNLFAIDTLASYTKAYSQEESKITVIFDNWLNIQGHDNNGNYSFDTYNLAIDSDSRLFAAISETNFAVCIGSLSLSFAWDCIYGGMLDDAQDSDAWGIGFADCRLRCHQIYKAIATGEFWHMQGSVFNTISSFASNNIKSQISFDRLSQNNKVYNAPVAGLQDYFTTFCTTFANGAILDFNQVSANLRYNSAYGSLNKLDDCAILMPAFYLEGTVFGAYGSTNLSNESPTLYYRGTLPFIYSGGLSLLQGFILAKDNSRYISTGKYFKLCMQCQ